MTTLVEQTEVPSRSVTLRTLAGLEARRYARHPLFLVGVALLAVYMVIVSKDLSQGAGASSYTGDADLGFMPAFLLGLVGVLVGFGLTRSMARSTEAVHASPADGVLRTAALCLACLVPGAVAVVWCAWLYLAMAVWPLADSAAISSTDHAAMLFAGVVCAVGGPLVGVMAGRWMRFPGAGLLALVVLYAWVGLAAGGLAMSASRVGSLVRLHAPFTSWISSDSPTQSDPWVAGGSPVWYLVYITLLCGVAAISAMLHEARGSQRSLLVRVWVLIVVLALASLALAVAPDPMRIPL